MIRERLHLCDFEECVIESEGIGEVIRRIEEVIRRMGKVIGKTRAEQLKA